MRRRRSSVGAHDGEMASCTKDKERHGVFRKYIIPLPWISVNINIAVFLLRFLVCAVHWYWSLYWSVRLMRSPVWHALRISNTENRGAHVVARRSEVQYSNNDILDS